jgi:hypothetical protein
MPVRGGGGGRCRRAGATPVPDRWHAAVRFGHASRTARGLGARIARRAGRDLERAKRRLWHGRRAGCRDRLAALLRWTGRRHAREAAGIDRLRRPVTGLLGYLDRDAGALVPYAARRRRGEPISTAFMESAVNGIVAERMTKRQRMRRDRATVRPFLDVRTAVLNGTLEDAFRRRYPGFRPADDGAALPAAA